MGHCHYVQMLALRTVLPDDLSLPKAERQPLSDLRVLAPEQEEVGRAAAVGAPETFYGDLRPIPRADEICHPALDVRIRGDEERKPLL